MYQNGSSFATILLGIFACYCQIRPPLGPEAKLAKFLDDYAKRFGQNRKLGKDYFNAVVELSIKSDTQLYPHCRNGLFALNLIADNEEEGVAKFADVSHVEKLKSQKLKPEVDKAEGMMATAWSKIHAAIANLSLTRDRALPMYGRLACRCMLHLLKLGKKGFDQRDYNSLDEINGLFHKDFLGNTEPPSPAAASSSQAGAGLPATLEEVSSAKWLSPKDGFAVGKHYSNKKLGKIFELSQMHPTHVIFTERTLGLCTPMVLNTPYEEVKKEWVPFKGNLQQRLEPADLAKYQLPASISIENDRGKVFAALSDLHKTHMVELKSFVFCSPPYEIWTSEETTFKRCELKLVPMTDSMARCMPSSVTIMSFVIASRQVMLREYRYTMNGIPSGTLYLLDSPAHPRHASWLSARTGLRTPWHGSWMSQK